MGFHKWRVESRTWRAFKPLARENRQSATEAEERLWLAIRGRKLDNAKFRRQHAIGHHIADFCCTECKLIVELDGGVHEIRTEQDAERTRELESRGFAVIRFANADVLDDLDAVVRRIAEILHARAHLAP